MVLHRGPSMEEWDDVEIQTVSAGLDARPRELHAAFEIGGDHLKEVRDRHTMLLVTSGELPETHIASIAPERRLDWIVEEMNGNKFKDGFSIPLHGSENNMINLSKGEIEGHSILRLRIGTEFERNIPIPENIDSINAVLEDGILSVKW